jgi:hypothetical protein
MLRGAPFAESCVAVVVPNPPPLTTMVEPDATVRPERPVDVVDCTLVMTGPNLNSSAFGPPAEIVAVPVVGCPVE